MYPVQVPERSATAMKRRRDFFKVLLLVELVLCVVWCVDALSQTSNVAPPLRLLVKINGKEISGGQDAMARFGNAVSTQSQKDAGAAMMASAITLKRDSLNKLAVYVVQGNGQLREVTSEPGLTVMATLGQLQYARGQLVAKASDTIGYLNLAGPIKLTVFYAPSGENGQIGLDEFFVRVTQ